MFKLPRSTTNAPLPPRHLTPSPLILSSPSTPQRSLSPCLKPRCRRLVYRPPRRHVPKVCATLLQPVPRTPSSSTSRRSVPDLRFVLDSPLFLLAFSSSPLPSSTEHGRSFRPCARRRTPGLHTIHFHFSFGDQTLAYDAAWFVAGRSCYSLLSLVFLFPFPPFPFNSLPA